MNKNAKVVGCLNCGYRTTNAIEIAEWNNCPNCVTEKNCGACGQFFGKDEADEIGFHSAKFCDASEENN
jgi:hypothetical protein